MTEMQPRKRATWQWIVAALIGVPVLYVLSIGPATLLLGHSEKFQPMYAFIYMPVNKVACCSKLLYTPFREYLIFWLGPNVEVATWEEMREAERLKKGSP